MIEISIYERTERSALTDGLTGLYNHAYFVQALTPRGAARQAPARLRGSRWRSSDLDDFKKVNDTRGDVEGDQRADEGRRRWSGRRVREIDIGGALRRCRSSCVVPHRDRPRAGALVVAETGSAQRIEEHFKRRRCAAAAPVTISGGVASVARGRRRGARSCCAGPTRGCTASKAAGKNRIALAAGERAVPPAGGGEARGDLERLRPRRTGADQGHLGGGPPRPPEGAGPPGSPVSLVIRPLGGHAFGLRGQVVRVEAAARVAATTSASASSVPVPVAPWPFAGLRGPGRSDLLPGSGGRSRPLLAGGSRRIAGPPRGRGARSGPTAGSASCGSCVSTWAEGSPANPRRPPPPS